MQLKGENPRVMGGTVLLRSRAGLQEGDPPLTSSPSEDLWPVCPAAVKPTMQVSTSAFLKSTKLGHENRLDLGIGQSNSMVRPWRRGAGPSVSNIHEC